MCPIDSRLYCPKRSQLFVVFLGPCVYLSWMNRLMSLYQIRRKIGHWNHSEKTEEGRHKNVFSLEKGCWSPTSAPTVFSSCTALSFQTRSRPLDLLKKKQHTSVASFYSLSCLPKLAQLESFLLSKEWLSYLKNNE